jgi:phytanoyl-CoA hydroxylase
MSVARPQIDSLKSEPYPEDLYRPSAIVTSGIPTLADFDDQAITRFREDGFVVVEQFYNEEELDIARQAIWDLVNTHEPEGYCLQFESGVSDPAALEGVDRIDSVRKLMTFAHMEPRMDALAHRPDVLALGEKLLGEPIALFQDMALLKPPHIGREKPWHQDQAYFNLPRGASVLGFWIALDDATLENGCMHFLAGGHHQGPVAHFNRRDWQICDSEIIGRPVVAVPVPAGGCLVFDGLVPHGTPTNFSGQRRRALQFHYRTQSTPVLPDSAERMETFGEEAHGATC